MHPEKNLQKRIARDRIEYLFRMAAEQFPTHTERAHRYVVLARSLSMKYKVPIPSMLKRKLCKQCMHFLQFGKNASIRYHKSRVIISCKDCGNIMRYPVT